MGIFKDLLTACAVLWIVLSEACFFKGIFNLKVGEPPKVPKEEWELQERYPRELRNCSEWDTSRVCNTFTLTLKGLLFIIALQLVVRKVMILT